MVDCLITIFLNFRFLLYKWISGDTNAIEGITDFEVIFRIPCRDVQSRDLTLFYERELKNSRTMFPGTSTLDYQIRKCNVLWIIDGFDESTAEAYGLLKAILKDLPDNHKVIITTRPASTIQLLKVEGMSGKQTHELSLEKFDRNQIKEVAQNKGIDQNQFEQYCKDLKYEDKVFLENPLNLNLVLQLWSPENNSFLKHLNTSKLYECLFEKQINELVIRLKDKTHLEESELKMSVNKWFNKTLCKFAVASILNHYHQLEVDQSHIYELADDATNKHLISSHCLSSFLDSEESSGILSFHYRHVIQKETFASIYLKSCNDSELEHFCGFARYEEVSRILYECNDYHSFLNFFTYFYQRRKLSEPVFWCDDLLRIENEKRERFDSLKQMFANSEKKLNIWGIFSPEDAKNLIELLLPEVTQFNCCLEMNLSDLDYKDWHNAINVKSKDEWNYLTNKNKVNFNDWYQAINEFKDQIIFTFGYKFSIESNDDVKCMLARVSEAYPESNQRCYEVFLNIYRRVSEFNFKHECCGLFFNIVRSFGTLFSSFFKLRCCDVFFNMVRSVSKTLFYSCLKSKCCGVFVNMSRRVSDGFLFSWFRSTCCEVFLNMIRRVLQVFFYSHFSQMSFEAFINLIISKGDPGCLLSALITIAEKFNSLTIRLNFYWYEGPAVVLDSKLLSQFASKIKVQELYLVIYSCNDFQLQLLNAVKVEEILNLDITGINDENFFTKLNLEMQTNLSQLRFHIRAKHLKCLYETIPQAIANETWVFIHSLLAVEDVPQPEGKQFRRIKIKELKKTSSYEANKALMKIAVHVKEM